MAIHLPGLTKDYRGPEQKENARRFSTEVNKKIDNPGIISSFRAEEERPPDLTVLPSCQA